MLSQQFQCYFYPVQDQAYREHTDDGKIYKIQFDGDECTIYDSICGYGVLNWKVENGKLLIWGDADLVIFNVEIDYEYEYTKDGSSIYLDGVEFKKQK